MKRLAVVVAAVAASGLLVVGGLRVAGSIAANGCLSNSALAASADSEGWTPVDEGEVPGNIGAGQAESAARKDWSGSAVLGARLVLLHSPVYGSNRPAFVVGFSVPAGMKVVGPQCVMQVVDAMTGQDLYGYAAMKEPLFPPPDPRSLQTVAP